MTNLHIIVAPDPRLLRISKSITDIDQEIKVLLNDMLKVMYKSNGIGLAAPQVGILKRLIVMDCTDSENKRNSFKFINPKILELSNEVSQFEEGCLSLPRNYAMVERPREIIVQYKDENGKDYKKKFSGIEATCLQHEIDHLDGKLFIDHISKLKRSRILQKLKTYKKKIK